MDNCLKKKVTSAKQHINKRRQVRRCPVGLGEKLRGGSWKNLPDVNATKAISPDTNTHLGINIINIQIDMASLCQACHNRVSAHEPSCDQQEAVKLEDLGDTRSALQPNESRSPLCGRKTASCHHVVTGTPATLLGRPHHFALPPPPLRAGHTLPLHALSPVITRAS